MSEHPRPPSLSVQNFCNSPPIPNIPPPKTQKSDYHRISRSASVITPISNRLILQDPENHQVFVGIDDFMKAVLHVPSDWRTEWGPTIEGIKTNVVFLERHESYTSQCESPCFKEEPLVDMMKIILDITCKSPLGSIQALAPHNYDLKELFCGVLDKRGLLPDDDKEETLKKQNLTLTQPFQVREVKPLDPALVGGSCMTRLMRNGQNPRAEHGEPPNQLRHRSEKPLLENPGQSADEGATSTRVKTFTSGKRPADESPEPGRKVQKQHQTSSPGKQHHTLIPLLRGGEYTQVGKYLFEQFSITCFRSHTTVGLVDRDRIQFYHANHSAVLVSSAISFGRGNKSDGLDKLIAIVIAFSRLSLRDKGTLSNLVDGKLFQENGELPTCIPDTKVDYIQKGRRLKIGGTALTYGEALSRASSLVGRSTAVIETKFSNGEGPNLVVKISWPGTARSSETGFLRKAIKAAEGTPKRWALKHLPKLFVEQDVTFGPESTHRKVASLFSIAEFLNGEYECEGRTLRILVQERLYALTALNKVKDIAQVLLDVLCIHRWLYKEVGILHRDLSFNNIMYRRIGGKVYGVLTDFDLSSWTASLTSDYTNISQQRTGTPPYMAYELLDGTGPIHLYRHDIESLFYVMLILATHYEIKIPKGGKKPRVEGRQGPFKHWFEQTSYGTLSDLKHSFLTRSAHVRPINLSPTFEDFRYWVECIRQCFWQGFRSKDAYENDKLLHQRSGDEAIPKFDDETLGGHLCYSALIDQARYLEGGLEGLIVRY